jgi:hypothetical protein
MRNDECLCMELVYDVHVNGNCCRHNAMKCQNLENGLDSEEKDTNEVVEG